MRLSRKTWLWPAVALLLPFLWAGFAQAGRPLPEGFKQARWGMTFKELKEVIPGLREDFNRFEPEVTAYHTFEFPNNGYAEFRLFRGELFYIRVKITSPRYNEQLLQSWRSYGEPMSSDEDSGARRYLWQDKKTAVALYLYPYYAELRAKSVDVASQWASYRKKEADVEDFLDQQLDAVFGAGGASTSASEPVRPAASSPAASRPPPVPSYSQPAPTPQAPPPPRPRQPVEDPARAPPPERSSQPAAKRPAPPPPPTSQPTGQEPALEGMEDFLR